MKTHTDKEQSRRLSEILRHESADMFWYRDAVTTEVNPRIMNYAQIPELQSMYYSPCWSLAALLSIIKPVNDNSYTLIGTLDGGATLSFEEVTNVMFQEDEIIDAVFKMIVWLKEIKKL